MNWTSIIINGGFALYLFNRLMFTDYTDRKWLWYFDGIFFALNFAAFLLGIF